MDVRIRPITDDELEAYCVALEVAFSGRLEEGDLDREPSGNVCVRDPGGGRADASAPRDQHGVDAQPARRSA